MQTDYCLFIDRKSGEFTDFTDLPFGDLEKLTRVAEAALKIPCVMSVAIKKQEGMILNTPRWGNSTLYEKENNDVRGDYLTEEQFKKDLREALKCDELFEALYKNKQEWKTFLKGRF